MNKDFWQQVVTPTLQNGSVFIAITTLSVSGITQQMVTKKRIDGSNIVEHLNFTMICDECREKGINVKCPHTILPHWLKDDALSDITKLLEEDQNAISRELYGILDENRRIHIFEQKYVDELFYGEKFDLDKDFINLYISLDPSCSGQKSKTSMIAFVEYEGLNIVSIIYFFFLFIP